MAGPQVRKERWILAALALFVGAVGCSRQNVAQGRQSTGAEKAQLTYIIGKICLPIMADHVPFAKIVASEGLKERKYCDIQECFTQYCPQDDPAKFCVHSVERSCNTEISDDVDVLKLSDMVSDILGADRRKWRRVKPIASGPAYARAFCDDDSTVSVSTSGFLPGQILGYIPRPPGGVGSETPIKVHRPEFDVRVSLVVDSSQCAPL